MNASCRATLPMLLFLAPGPLAAQGEPAPRPFLRKVIGLDDAQLAAIDKGEVVTKLLPTTEKAEIAAFGVVRTSGTPEVLLRLARDVQKFRKVPQISEMALFSNPPASRTSPDFITLRPTSRP